MKADGRVRFLAIWGGQAISRLGSEVVSFALIWWLTVKAGSVSTLAVATLVTLLPPVLLGPFAGAVVDRRSRRAVMLVSDVTIAAFTLLLALLYRLDAVRPWHLYAIMAVRAVGGSFHGPAMRASTTLLVAPDDLQRVGGMNQALAGALRIGAPPLGALLVGLLPMHAVALLDVLTALFAVVPLAFIAIPRPGASAPGPAPASPPRRPSLVRDAAEGLRYVAARRTLLFVVVSCTITNITLGPVLSFGPLLVREIFGGGAVELGLVSSASGVGLILGGLVMTAWRGFRRKLATSAVGWLGLGLAFLAVPAIPGSAFAAFVAVRFLASLMVPVGSAPLEAWYQSHVSPDMQGRVFAVLGSIDGLTVPFGLAAAGLFGQAVPLRLWWGLVGIEHALLGILWLVLPLVRRAEEPAADVPVAPSA